MYVSQNVLTPMADVLQNAAANDPNLGDVSLTVRRVSEDGKPVRLVVGCIRTEQKRMLKRKRCQIEDKIQAHFRAKFTYT